MKQKITQEMTIEQKALTKSKFSVREMTMVALFVALISVGAFIKVPVPVCPFTLQFLFTTMAGMLLGKRLGATAVTIYVLLGLAGFPVFASGGGITYVFTATFGYLIGFALGAYVTGWLVEKQNAKGGELSMIGLVLANFAGLMVVYLCGMVYYYFISMFYLSAPIGIWPLFLYCFLLAVPGDIVLCFAASILGKRLVPALGFNKK